MKTRIEINVNALAVICALLLPASAFVMWHTLAAESWTGTFVSAVIMLLSLIMLFWYFCYYREEQRNKERKSRINKSRNGLNNHY